MAQELKTFKDIYTAVAEELGVPTSDDTTINRIKRNINMVYINEIIPAARWPWLLKRKDIFYEKQYNSDGSDTASVTKGSTTVTLSSSIPSAKGSKAGFLFKDLGHNETYIIDSHTAGSDTLTLSSEYTGETNTEAGFRIWTNEISLPQDASEVIDIRHDYQSRPLIPRGAQKLDELAQVDFDRVDEPKYYATDAFEGGNTEATRNRFTRVWPSRSDNDVTLHVTYKQEVDALDADFDEPILPIEDRIVIFYGAAAYRWKAETNTQDAANSWQFYQNKLNQMISKWRDSTDLPRLEIDSRYTEYRRNAVGKYRGW